MNALNQLTNLPERKEQIKTFAAAGIDEILNGNYSALEFKMRADFIRKALDQIEAHAAVKDLILLEGKKYEGQDYFGCQIKSQSRKTYDFNACNDSEYTNLSKYIESLKTQLKAREAFLKALPAPMADPETGNIINPPTFTSSEFLVIK